MKIVRTGHKQSTDLYKSEKIMFLISLDSFAVGMRVVPVSFPLVLIVFLNPKLSNFLFGPERKEADFTSDEQIF